MARTFKDTVEIGRLGPATNLRPAGAHQDSRRKPRSANKAQLRREVWF